MFDLASEVIGWPETLKLGTILFLFRAGDQYARFIREALAQLRAKCAGVLSPTPPPLYLCAEEWREIASAGEG